MIEYTVKVYENGRKEWYLNGNLHREDGPAIELANGVNLWYLNGKRHRVDGPAIECAWGDKEWYLNGKEYTEEEFLAIMQPVKEYSIAELEEILGHRVKVVK